MAVTRLTQISPLATGSNQTYNITVSNAGPSVATGVTLTNQLPAGVSYVGAVSSQGGCTQTAGVVVCALGTLNASNSATIQIDAIPITAGSQTNTVRVGGEQLDLNAANNTLLAVATVQDLPMINFGPQSQIVTNGGTATFSVSASGTSLRYQWLLNGGNLSGATNAMLTIVNTQPAQAGSYTVRVTNDVGAALSSPATLTVLGPVSINTQPQGRSVLAGSAVTFTVAASGSPPITYQWEVDGSELPGQTGPSLVLAAVQTNQAGAYRVRVTNPIGSVNSAVANLAVLELPVFLVQPQSVTNVAGSVATLTSLVGGTAPLGYQWFFNQTNLLAGQTNASILFTNAQTNHSGAYTLLASNIAGVRTSAVAVLTVYEMDFGDAPESSGYPTTLAFNGARHRLVPGVRLGALVDSETNGAPNVAANGDDLAGVDDEDGVLFPAALLLGQTAFVPVIASTNGFLDAWIDFNGNGSWGDPGEQVLASRPIIPGTNSIPFAISPGALPGLRYVRCRFSTVGGLAPDGFAPDGEVEDYRITLQSAVDLAVGLEDLSDPTSVSSNLLYLMTVTNRGPSTATSVMLTNLLPPSFTFVQGQPSQGYCGDIGGRTIFCPVDNIPPGGVVTMLLTVRPTVPGTFLNTASASATEPELNPADNTITQTTSVVLPPTSYTNAAPLPVADATPAGPGVGNPYPSTILVSGLTSAVYKVTVRLNNLSHPFSKDFDVLLVGPQGQTVLLMSDAGAGSLGGVTLTFDDAADGPLPSTGVIVTGTYRPSNYGAAPDVFPAPAPAGPYSTALSALNGTDPNGRWSLYVVDGTIAGNGSIAGGWQLTISTADPIADLAVTSVGTPAPVPVNSNLVYSLTVTNRGPAVADNAVLTNTLPPGVTFVSATSTLGSCTPQAGLVTCAFGSLSAGAGAAVTVTVRPTTVGLLTNITRATANRLDLVTANNLVQTIIPARLVTDLVVAQNASTNLVLLGEQISYTINVTNRGPNPANNIRLVDVLPATFNFLTVSTTQGACSNLAGTITCDLGTLASNARAQVMLAAAPTVLGPQGSALSATNRVQVASDEVESLSANNVAEVVTLVSVAADVGVSMVDSPDPVAVGQTLTYDLVLTNRGPSFAYDVQLTNALPANVTFLSAIAPDGVCSYSNGIVNCALGILTPGASTLVSIAVSPTAAGRLTNSARASTVSIDVAASNNLASVVTDAALAPSILTQPQSRTVTNGGNAVFTVSAGGTGPLSYQWLFTPAGPQACWPAGEMAGRTNATLLLTNAQPCHAGSYTVRVSNGVGSLFSQAATLTVLVPPGISDIGDLLTDEDTLTAVVAFTVSDVDAPPTQLTLSYTSTDTNLVPQAGVFFGGSGSNRTVQILPGTNRFGSATVTITARDAQGLSASDSFVLTVRPVEDAPSLSELLDRSMLEDGVLAIPFSMSDAETPADLLNVSATSSNTVLFPPANVTLSGSGTNRLLLLQPAANLSGSGSFSVKVTDTNGLSMSRAFVVSVAPVNDPPTLNQPANLVINEDAGVTNVLLSGIGSGASNEFQSLRISAASDRPGLIPDPVVVYSSPDASGSLSFAPATNANGVATITVRVDDGGASNNVLVRTFTVAVSAVNDLPVVSGIADQVVDEGVPTPLLAFSVQDVETPVSQLTLSYTSSDTNLVPLAGGPAGQQAGVFFGGSGSNRTVQVRPAPFRWGVALISLSVSDGDGGVSVRGFQLTVRQVTLPPVISGQPVSLTVTNGGAAGFSVSVGGTGPFSYQWRRSGADGLGATNIPGQTNASLSLTNVQGSDAGGYSVVATNPVGQAVSGVALLRVLVSPRITAIAPGSPGVRISFSTVAGLSYTVEFKNAPDSPGWNPLGPVAGTGGVVTVADPAAIVPSRIYRVRVE